MLQRIYLDHNATTPIDSRVAKHMFEIADKAFANPGSSHALGREARISLDLAREDIARVVDCAPQDLIFTSGGTESVNSAISGLAAAVKVTAQKTLLNWPGQHASSRESVKRLVLQGWTVYEIPITKEGLVDESKLAEFPWEDISLVNLILGHNETGVLSNIKSILAECKSRQIACHIDAVQVVGKLPISFRNLGVSALSFAAHKFGGPRGIGGLIMQEGVPYVPLMVGGFQENNRRPGTENVVLASGMALALKLWMKEREFQYSHRLSLCNRFESGLKEKSPTLEIIAEDTDRLPNTSSIMFPGVEGEALLIALDLAGICCSMGSACASGSVDPSPILLAMGYTREEARSTLRFSFGLTNTSQEIDSAIQVISETYQRLRAV
jgi:cysteine desulfurase